MPITVFAGTLGRFGYIRMGDTEVQAAIIKYQRVGVFFRFLCLMLLVVQEMTRG